MGNPELQKLFTTLLQNGVPLTAKSPQEFEQNMGDETNMRHLYDGLNSKYKDVFDLPDYNTFRDKYSPEKKKDIPELPSSGTSSSSPSDSGAQSPYQVNQIIQEQNSKGGTESNDITPQDEISTGTFGTTIPNVQPKTIPMPGAFITSAAPQVQNPNYVSPENLITPEEEQNVSNEPFNPLTQQNHPLAQKITQNPKDITSRYEMGNMLNQENKPDQAINHYQSIVEQDPNNYQGNYGLGYSYAKMAENATNGNKEANGLYANQTADELNKQALDYFTNLAKNDKSHGTNPQIYQNLSLIQSRLGMDKQAQESETKMNWAQTSKDFDERYTSQDGLTAKERQHDIDLNKNADLLIHTILSPIYSAGEGIKAGTEQVIEGANKLSGVATLDPEALNNGSTIPEAIGGITAGAVKALFSAAGLVVPEVASFNVGTDALNAGANTETGQSIGADKAMQVLMQPLTSLKDKIWSNTRESAEGEKAPKWADNIATIGDILAQGVMIHGISHSGANIYKSISEKFSKGEPLTEEEQKVLTPNLMNTFHRELYPQEIQDLHNKQEQVQKEMLNPALSQQTHKFLRQRNDELTLQINNDYQTNLDGLKKAAEINSQIKNIKVEQAPLKEDLKNTEVPEVKVILKEKLEAFDKLIKAEEEKLDGLPKVENDKEEILPEEPTIDKTSTIEKVSTEPKEENKPLNTQEDAVQEQSTTEVHGSEPDTTGKEGSEHEGVGAGDQLQETAGKGETKEEPSGSEVVGGTEEGNKEGEESKVEYPDVQKQRINDLIDDMKEFNVRSDAKKRSSKGSGDNLTLNRRANDLGFTIKDGKLIDEKGKTVGKKRLSETTSTEGYQKLSDFDKSFQDHVNKLLPHIGEYNIHEPNIDVPMEGDGKDVRQENEPKGGTGKGGAGKGVEGKPKEVNKEQPLNKEESELSPKEKSKQKLEEAKGLTGEQREKLFPALVGLAKAYIEHGAYELADWVNELSEKFPQWTKKELTDAYNEAKGEKPEEEIVSETEPEKSTGIKHEQTTKERAERNLDPISHELARTFPEVWENAKDSVDKGEGKYLTNRILEQHSQGKVQPLRAEETVTLALNRVRILNERDTISGYLNQAAENGEDISAYQTSLARINEELNNNDEAARVTGYEQGLGLAIRRLMLKRDYSIDTVLTNLKAENGGKELPQDIIDKVNKLTIERDNALKELEKTREELIKKESEAVVKKAKREEDHEQRKIKRVYTKEKLKVERNNLFDKLAEFSKKYEGRLGANDIVQPIEKLPIWYDLVKNYVKDGYTSIEDIVDDVHENVKDIFDGITKKQVREYLSGYGNKTELSKDAILKEVRELRSQGRLISALKDAESGERPKRSGLQRDEPSQKVRELQKRIQVEMRKHNFTETPEDKANRYKSVLEGIKTRLKNSIDDLNKQIETGEKIPKTDKAVEYDAEAKALKEQRDALKTKFDEVFGKHELSDEQRINLASKAVQRAIDDLNRRIAENDIESKTTRKTPETPELKALKEQRKGLMKNLIQMRKDNLDYQQKNWLKYREKRLTDLEQQEKDLNEKGLPEKVEEKPIEMNPKMLEVQAKIKEKEKSIDAIKYKLQQKQRTKLDKVLNFGSRFARMAKLGNPTTIAKLSMYDIYQGAPHALIEGIGGAWETLPPVKQIAKASGMEGGVNVKAISKFYSEFFSKAMWNDTKRMISERGYEGELESLYGKGHMDKSWLNFFGEIHSALKNPIKRASFQAALEKRTAKAIRQGVNIYDPMVSAELGAKAFMDAQRVILQNDNVITKNIWNPVIRWLRNSKFRPETSKVLANTLEWLAPIVKVPTNFVISTTEYAYGMPVGVIKGLYSLTKSIYKGIKLVDAVSPDEADFIMRNLKKGTAGIAMVALGYANPDMFGGFYQRGINDDASVAKTGHLRANELRIGDWSVPTWLRHAPILEMLQVGASLRNFQEQQNKKKQKEAKKNKEEAPIDDEGLFNAMFTPYPVLKTMAGIAQENPFSRTGQELSQASETGDWYKLAAQQLVGSIVPYDVTRAAKYFDTDDNGKEIKRDAKIFGEYIEENIPGLRQNVPVKVEKKKKHH